MCVCVCIHMSIFNVKFMYGYSAVCSDCCVLHGWSSLPASG